MKHLVHRIGFRCWIGPEANSPKYSPRLIKAFEQLDPGEYAVLCKTRTRECDARYLELYVDRVQYFLTNWNTIERTLTVIERVMALNSYQMIQIS